MNRTGLFGSAITLVILSFTIQAANAQLMCTASGSVTDVRGIKGIAGVEIWVAVPGYKPALAATTNDLGLYRFQFPCGRYSATVTPQKDCLVFNPASRDVTSALGDITIDPFVGASAGLTYTISGNTGVAGVTMSGLPGTPISNVSGNYTATVSCGWSGTVTPTKACYSFTPASTSYSSVTANKTTNYTASLNGPYTISGLVTDSSAAPIPGVTMSGLSTSTDAAGNYSASIACGGNAVVTPAKAGYTFVPPSASHTNVTSNQTQNYTGSLISLTISGFVRDSGGQGIAGVSMTGFPSATSTAADGSYSATVTYGWTGTVVPSKSCYYFTQPSATYTNLTTNAATDYTGSVVQYTISGYVKDGAGTPIPGVTINGLPGNPVTNDLGFYSAGASCGVTYTATPAKANYSFAPPSIAYPSVAADQPNQNYTGTLGAISISGYVKTAAGDPIPGVAMNGLPGNPATLADGSYTASTTPPFSGTVTPTKACYVFNPPSTSYSAVVTSQTAQNYTGTALTYTISGSIKTGAGAGISGVVMSGLPGNPSTDASGNYSVTVSCGWSGTVTPSKTCYAFNPPSTVYSNVSANQTTNYTGTEGSVTISGFTFTQAGAPIKAVVMNGLPGNPSTLQNGSYSASVACGWSGTVTPTLSCYTFNPASTSYSNVTVSKSTDYIGTAAAFTISGYVRNAAGAGISGVIMTGLPGNPATDASGRYQANVSCGWSGTVTPTKDCHSFNPPSTTYSSITASKTTDYTGSQGNITISGYVRTEGGAGIGGVVMQGLPGNPATKNDGSYSAGVSCGWSGTVTPNKTGYTFEPPSTSYSNLQTGKTTNYTGKPTLKVTEDFAIGLRIHGEGWLEFRGVESVGFAHKDWVQVSWPDYDQSNGASHAACGDIDGDGEKELVVGLGSGGAGWLEIFKKYSTGWASYKWIQINDIGYNSANGLSTPAIGDVDGDGKNEIVVGLGSGSRGFLEIFGDASTNFVEKAWIQVDYADYNAADGSTVPAIGDVDGDGKNEIVVGLGRGSNGWVAILNYSASGYSLEAWLQVPWSDYNARNGATFPAIGDVDGDGKNELIIGLGEGGGGWLEVVENGQKSYQLRQWLQVSWADYASIGESHPACIDVDGDGIKELVIGLGQGSAGWLEILNNATKGFASKSWIQLSWPGYNSSNGSTTPAP